MKKLHLLIIHLLLILTASAQSAIGLEAGLSSNYLHTNLSGRASTAINSGTGFTIGLPCQYPISKWLNIRATPGLTQKRYQIARTDSLAGVYENFNNTYLQLPVECQIVYGHRLRVFLAPGMYVGYWLSGRVKGKIPDVFAVTATSSPNGGMGETYPLSSYNENYSFDSHRDNRFEAGWTISGGIQYQLNKRYLLISSCKYYQSLTDQQKDYSINQVAQYNETVTFTAGLLFMLHRK